MKIRLEQLNITIGNLDGNLSLIEQALSDARSEGVDLLVLPELVVCGYSPGDLLERSQFLEAVYKKNDKVTELTKETALLFGTLTPNRKEVGRSCYNSAVLAHRGRVHSEVHKALLPTYDVYDELRYFEADKAFETVEFKGVKLGITICEDIWHNFELPYISYDLNPVEELIEKGAEAIINISASPYTRNKPDKRKEMLQRHARKWKVPVFYANQVGGNTELLSDGDSMALNSDAEVVGRAPLFEEASVDIDWNTENDTLVASSDHPATPPKTIEQMFRALVMGLKDYLQKTGVADDVIIGLSGGIDSALAAVIAVEALGAENVVGVTMPSEFSSKGSITDSQKLADNLGMKCHEIAIKEIYEEFNEALEPLFLGTSFGTAEENIQPRIRGTLLMAYSNKFGNMLLNTGNKSELATGYCTLYGDMSGGLGIIADLYKKEVYEMARWLNNEYFQQEIIPEATITKPPSAELRPDQKDVDTLPDYNILDPILQAYIEDRCSIEEIVERGYDIEVVKRITKLVDRMEYKRFQAVPALKVSDKAFGSGRRIPLAQRWTDSRL